MNIYVDIDGTICTPVIDGDYSKALPILKHIKKINKLYDEGHTITYWTARGTLTEIDWEKCTKEQFKKWDVKYHILKFEKPAYDLLIDDKTKIIEDM